MIRLLYFSVLTVCAILADNEDVHLTIGEKNEGSRVTFARGRKGFRRDDLMLSEDQNAWLFHSDEEINAGNRTKRAGTEMKSHVQFWPNGVVPYVIEPNHFNSYEEQELREAMDVYEEMTCLKFVKRTRETQWLYFHHTNDGCYSLLGMASSYSPGPQPVSLQEPGCRHFGTYLHEIGHAIGLVHEHQLPTRNNHVRFYETNVDPENANQLTMYDARVIQTFNTPYDLGSIMHYDITSFSIDDVSPTLGVDNPWLAQHIGRRYSNLLSFGDARTVNRLYKCAMPCGQNIVANCFDPGYVNKKGECLLPKTYHDRYCKDKPGFEAFCNQLAPTGKCDIRNLEHHKTCANTCGFCPRFVPGDSAIGPRQEQLGKTCLDRYHNPARCQRWQNHCQTSLWMHRNCRATCGACKSVYGDCPNMESDSICDQYQKMRLCGDPKMRAFMTTKCPDSCDTCGFTRSEDLSCRNKLPDNECRRLASAGGCERNPLQMFTNCPSSCDRCYFNAGTCRNQANDQECTKLALQNHCVAVGQRFLEMKKLCQKTCDTCPRGGGW